VGLSTARGSGTNGYVQRSRAYVRPKTQSILPTAPAAPPVDKKPNFGILAHEARRKIEVEILKEQEKMKERGLNEAEIEKKCAALRQRMLEKLERNGVALGGRGDSHSISAMKQRSNEKMRQALGIKEGEWQEGKAFAQLEEKRKIAEGLMPPPESFPRWASLRASELSETCRHGFLWFDILRVGQVFPLSG